jgi:transposase
MPAVSLALGLAWIGAACSLQVRNPHTSVGLGWVRFVRCQEAGRAQPTIVMGEHIAADHGYRRTVSAPAPRACESAWCGILPHTDAEAGMKRFVEGEDRRQTTLLPDCIEDCVSEENPVRVIEAFVAALDLAELGFEGVVPERTGRPGCHPATLLKLYVHGYSNRIPSSRRLEREAGRNLELMWLTGRLAPDFETIADFRKDNGPAIRATCRRFVLLCRELGLLAEAAVAIDGSKLKAVNARERNYTANVVRRRMERAEASVARYLAALETADRQEEETARARTGRLKDRLAGLARRMERLREMEAAVRATPDGQVSLTDPDARAMASGPSDLPGRPFAATARAPSGRESAPGPLGFGPARRAPIGGAMNLCRRTRPRADTLRSRDMQHHPG